MDNTTDDYAEFGDKDFTKMYYVLSIESSKIRNSNAMHLGKKSLAAILSTIVYR